MQFLLRSAFLVRADTDQEAQLRNAGELIAQRLNQAEASDDSGEPVALADCEELLDDWPSWNDPGWTPVFVAAHNFNSWNHHDHVWNDIRNTPVRFQPIPAEDTDLLNRWLFSRYRFPKSTDRLPDALKRAIADAPRHNSPRKLIAEGLDQAIRNTENLISLTQSESTPTLT